MGVKNGRKKKIGNHKGGKDATLTNLLRWANGSSLINQKVKREGLVFKSIKHVDGEIIKFKIINNAYLLKEGE